MDNKVNDLCYAVKFENHKKNKIIFLLSKTFLFFIIGKVFFMSPKNSIASAFFLPRQILKNIDMPRQKPWHLLTAKVNFERCSYFLKALILETSFFLKSCKFFKSCCLSFSADEFEQLLLFSLCKPL